MLTITDYSVYIAENSQQLKHNSLERKKILTDVADYIIDRDLTLSQRQSAEHILNSICNKIDVFTHQERHQAKQLSKHLKHASHHSRSKARSPSAHNKCIKKVRSFKSSTNTTSNSKSASKAQAKSKCNRKDSAKKTTDTHAESHISQLHNEIKCLKQQKQQLSHQVQEISLVMHILLI